MSHSSQPAWIPVGLASAPMAEHPPRGHTPGARSVRIVYLLLSFCWLSGCASSQLGAKVSSADISGTICGDPSVNQFFPSDPPLLKRSSRPELPASGQAGDQDVLSPRVRNMADIIGVRNLFQEKRLLELEASQHPERPKERLFELRQELSTHLFFTSLDIGAATAYVDCEETRAEHVATALSDARDRSVQRLTMVAIVGEALVGIVGIA